MRVCATDFAPDQARCVRIINPSMNDLDRKDALELVQAEVNDFAQDYFLAFELPSAPTVRFLGMDGFEDTKKPFDKVSGIFRFALSFSTASNHTIQIEFPFPYSRGYLLTPAIAIFGKQKFVFSQSALVDLLKKFESVRPKLSNPLQPSMRVDHLQNIERPLFSAPNDPSGWSDLISERYM
jgi:hypothetical protein